MTSTNKICLKFGKYEHIEALRKGEIFFNAIKNYRDDGTDYRGDKNEGALFIDPVTIQIFDKDGNDIFNSIPRPSSIKETLTADDNTYMFCCADITKEILTKERDNLFRFSIEFIDAIEKFGEYVILFEMDELLSNIRKYRLDAAQPFGYKACKVRYVDKEHDFDFMTEGFREQFLFKSVYDRYFIKDLQYKYQNEYRIVIDGETENLKCNCGDGYLLKTSLLETGRIYKTKDFLQWFRIKLV